MVYFKNVFTYSAVSDVARLWRFHVFPVTQGNRCNVLELFICFKGHPPLPSPALAGSHYIKSVVYCREIAQVETKS